MKLYTIPKGNELGTAQYSTNSHNLLWVVVSVGYNNGQIILFISHFAKATPDFVIKSAEMYGKL
uniref:Uncharacterized protein n=1 Tax=Siphoviridae sp. ctNHg2 TaxID=2825467 RepID=A0A8S5V4B2_9CAUD|nr:MAG TPA: hypothetical protein [Siphoviridae sp. ctNHg2]